MKTVLDAGTASIALCVMAREPELPGTPAAL